MKKVLLLGAGGFIGSHLAGALSRRKNDYLTTAVDITRKKFDEAARGIKYIHLDIRKQKRKLRRLIKKHDIIVNMVAIANPGMYVKNPLGTFELDFKQNLVIIELCAKYRKRLIHFSTSEVYGKSPSIYVKNKAFHFNVDKSDFILGPINKHRWIYACSKQLLDRVIHAFGLQKNLNYTIIRPFNYIGPRIDFLPSEEKGIPRVFSYFMDALLYDNPMYLVDGGKQKRCYTSIKDATVAHMLVINNLGNVCNKKIFNIGTNSNETTIENLAKVMQEVYKKNFMTVNKVLPSIKKISGEEFYGRGYEDSDRRLLDSSDFTNLTGWQPEQDLKTMVYEGMKYYVDRHNRKQSGICKSF